MTADEVTERINHAKRVRFGNLWGLGPEHQYTKEFLLQIIGSELIDNITYNDKVVPVTFSMKYLAKELLKVDYHTFM
jgi:hypothetical protein